LGLNLGTKAIIGLAGGLAVGAALAATGHAAALTAGAAIEIGGKLWINAILMTILPFVVSKLVGSIAGSGDPREIGRAGWRAGAVILGLLTGTAVLAVVTMPMVFARLPINAATSAALRASVSAPVMAGPNPSAAQWILELVPTNAIRAAADGTMVPLLVFSVAFALGAARIPQALRDPLVTLVRSVDATITVVLNWIVSLSPYGVFALGVGLAIRVGVGIVSALAYYVVVSAVAQVVFTVFLYLVVLAGAGVSPLRFARAAAPAQIVAFSTHSSMASLPAMVEGAERHLGLSQTATGFVLPLSLAVFKYSSPVWFVVVTCFVGRLYGIAIDPSHTVAIVLTAVVTSFAVGGVPSGAVVVVAPVLAAAGLPIGALGLLLAIDPIPNAFRTVANVTGMLAVTTLADGRDRERRHVPEQATPRPPRP
jgi:Na+/H+-dicarboxylate symporter